MSDNSSHSAHAETLSGGAVRVSFGVPAQGPDLAAHSGPSTRVHDGAVRWTAGGPAEEVGGVARHTISHDGSTGGSVLATRQRINGRDSVLMTPGDPGSRVELRMAVQLGLLKETAPGVYADATTADGKQKTAETVQAEQQQALQQQGREQAQQEAADLEGVFNPTEDAAWQADFANVPEHAFQSTMASMVNAVTLAGDFTQAVNTMVRDAGVEPAVAAEMVANAYWGQEQIVSRALAKVGIGEDMKEAAYAAFRDQPGKLQNAMQFLLHGRDVSHFQQLGREWLAKSGRVAASGGNGNGGTPPTAPTAPVLTEAALRDAGFQTSTTRQGVLMVKAGASGKWIPASDLLKG